MACGFSRHLINPQLKRQVLRLQQAPYHAVGEVVFFTEAGFDCPPKEPIPYRTTQLDPQIGVAPVAHTRLVAAAASAVAAGSVPMHMSQLLAGVAPTSGPNAVIPQPAPLLSPVIPPDVPENEDVERCRRYGIPY